MKNPNREAQIIEMYKTGHSMPEIAKLFEVSRQRIQQILTKHKISSKDRIKRPKPPRTSICIVCNQTFTSTTKWKKKTCSLQCFKKLRSVQNTSRKLTESDIPIIKELYWKKGLTQTQIAKRFNVTTGCINQIINEKKWNHVKDKVDITKTQRL